ncbi:ribosomal RNA small subunit methyltransferase A [Candidatus Falkowbacteria bacterium]|jgi:16S rRNA (adenine1518-N6/adenine1519-N6)-dimethyltransferase|nr:ribosomal RNA small subunit methyltransferase A [Candidatus Falkowbacteria bacterium]MBT5503652.1 ribosomal RNA small subunit methyltransferase A [Candidatus Falkowbacteria bacterium]MBT6574116.1 ribosomal RNA small subunit methyltransferase A [Candidatus Falkowbacteria bacterium]MBT7500678.1 ribosomal RNA small subunit methyltransferase A [Candidatus Falkowbacteria bacterium]
MNLTELKQILREEQVQPSKFKGQNFLIDNNILDKIIKSADVQKKDNVVEVGPGFGSLTFRLDEVAGNVLAVEKDNRIYRYLSEQKFKNTKVICHDILKIGEPELLKELGSKKFRVIANLPYSITSRFIRRFFEFKHQPRDMVLMVQREVAERMLVKEGDINLLSLAVNFYSEPKILFRVSPRSFFPEPTIESSVIHLANIKPQFKVDPAKFFLVARTGFSAKRKQLRRNLAKFGLEKVDKAFEKLGIKDNVRAQQLSLQQWVDLVKHIG